MKLRNYRMENGKYYVELDGEEYPANAIIHSSYSTTFLTIERAEPR